MYQTVNRTILQEQMIQQGDRIAVGLSGGADSVALLHFLWKIRPTWHLDLTACHVNHMLRGAEADRDEAFVRTLCHSLEIPLTVVRKDVGAIAKEQGRSVEEMARQVRYDAFARLDADRVATAHTLNDNLETVLLNLVRGTGLRGLCGIPPVRGRIIRPLIHCTRAQVEAYCREQNLHYVTDSTNLQEDYTRNRLRRQVLPRLLEINPNLLSGVGGMIQRLRQDEDFLTQAAQQAQGNWLQGEALLVAPYLQAPKALRQRGLLALLRERNIPITAQEIHQMEDQMAAGQGTLTLPGPVYFWVKDGRAGFRTPVQAPVFPAQPLKLGRMRLPDGSWATILRAECEQNKKITNSAWMGLKNAIDCDKINGNSILRTRRPGDRLSLPERGVTKPLKKWLNEAKVPLEQRDTLAVLADDMGPLWVQGLGSDRRVRPDHQTRYMLTITIATEE